MGRKGKGREGKGKGIVIKAPGVWLGWGRYLKVCSMHAPSHFPYAHSYPQPPASISDSPISHLHPRLPNYSHLQPPTRIDLHHRLACPLTQLQPLTPPSHPASTCTNKERIENPTLNHYTFTVTDRAKRTTRLYVVPYFTNLTLPYQPYLTNLTLPTLPWRA